MTKRPNTPSEGKPDAGALDCNVSRFSGCLSADGVGRERPLCSSQPLTSHSAGGAGTTAETTPFRRQSSSAIPIPTEILEAAEEIVSHSDVIGIERTRLEELLRTVILLDRQLRDS
jgi:hypothetical protein